MDINVREIEAIDRYLQPYGQGNSKPLFLIRGASLKYVKEVGSGHLSVYIEQKYDGAVTGIGGIGWNMYTDIDTEELYDIEGYLELNEWNDSVRPRFVIKKLKPYREDNLYLYVGP